MRQADRRTGRQADRRTGGQADRLSKNGMFFVLLMRADFLALKEKCLSFMFCRQNVQKTTELLVLESRNLLWNFGFFNVCTSVLISLSAAFVGNTWVGLFDHFLYFVLSRNIEIIRV